MGSKVWELIVFSPVTWTFYAEIVCDISESDSMTLIVAMVFSAFKKMCGAEDLRQVRSPCITFRDHIVVKFNFHLSGPNDDVIFTGRHCTLSLIVASRYEFRVRSCNQQ